MARGRRRSPPGPCRGTGEPQAGSETLALRAATKTVPIVFVAVADPVLLGLVSSLAHPGGNVTGLATVVPEEFGTKQVELLKQTVPAAVRMAVLINPENPLHRAVLAQTVAAAKKLSIRLQILEARTPNELDSAFAAATREHADVLQVVADNLFNAHRANCGARGEESASDAVPLEGRRAGRGADVLCATSLRHVPARPHLRGQDPQGRETRRPARRATDEVRAGHQPQNREGTRPDHPTVAVGAGGSGD